MNEYLHVLLHCSLDHADCKLIDQLIASGVIKLLASLLMVTTDSVRDVYLQGFDQSSENSLKIICVVTECPSWYLWAGI